MLAPDPHCTADSLHEVEPNDTPDTATVLGTPWVICGSVAPGEVDYIAVRTPAPPFILEAFDYAASWEGFGNPVITLTAGDVTVPAGAQAPLVQGGATYTFKIVGNTAPVTYALSVVMGGGAVY